VVYHPTAGLAGSMSDARHIISNFAGGLSRRFMIVAVAITLFGGSLILYAPSLGFGFIGYDEGAVLLVHPNLYNQPSLASSARQILLGYFPREEPLIVRDLSWLVDARLFGFTNPLGYHLGNVALNAIDVVLLFLFLLHATRSLPFAGLTAALFASLAIHVEPVCWAMGRKDVLAAFFTLLALLLQSMALREPRRPRRLALHAVVFLLCPLAILSKFSAIVLAPLLALHRLFAPFLEGARGPRERLDLRSRWRELAGFLPHLAVTAGLFLWYQRQLSAFQVIGGRGPSALSLQHLETLALLVPLSLARTLGHIAWAAAHSISYLRPNVALPLLPGEIASIVAMVLGSAAALWVTLRYRKALAFFVLAFFLFMLPYCNVEYIGIWVADRYAYLSSFCVVALLSALAIDGWRSQRVWAHRLGAVLFLGLAILGGLGLVAGRKHQQAFRDARAFWSYELSLAQPSMLAFESYAKTALGDAATAEPGSPERRQAIERVSRTAGDGIRYYHTLPWRPAPGYFSRDRAHLAGLYSTLGHAATLSEKPLEDRLRYFQQAYQIMPNQQTALMLAQVLLDMARRAPPSERLARESLGYFEQYLRQASSDPLRRHGLARLLGQYTEAFPALAGDVSRITEEILK
jgi:hypothetical protein